MIIGVVFSQINGVIPLNGRGRSFKTKGAFHLKERPDQFKEIYLKSNHLIINHLYIRKFIQKKCT